MKSSTISLWIVRVLLIMSAVATFGGIAEQLRIQQASFAQPTAPAGAYAHALRLHGPAHFITDSQQSMLGLARDGLYFGFPLLLILGITHQVMMVRNSPVKSNFLTRGLDKRLKLAPMEPETESAFQASGPWREPVQPAEPSPPAPATVPATPEYADATPVSRPDDVRPRQLIVDVLPLQLGSVSIGRHMVSFLFDDACISTSNSITVTSGAAEETSDYDTRNARGALALSGCFHKKLLTCVLTDDALYLRFEGGTQARLAIDSSGRNGTINTRNECIVF